MNEYEITHDIQVLDPKINEPVAADILGNGRFLNYKLISVGKTCFRLMWMSSNGKSEITARIKFNGQYGIHDFWRGTNGLLHYQFRKDNMDTNR